MAKNINVAYDWLNMFTKVSERLYLAFFVKMGRTRAMQDRANELRRIQTNKVRQASFIAEYVQNKYFTIYAEAANFFNVLHTLYPTKYDLRKTREFRDWKTSSIQSQLPTKRRRTQYLKTYTGVDIQSDEETPFQQHVETAQQHNEMAQSPEHNEMAQSPEHNEMAQSPEHNEMAQSPEHNEMAQSPEHNEMAQSPEHNEMAQSPEHNEMAQSPEHNEMAQSPEHNEMAQSPEHNEMAQSPERIEMAQSPEQQSRPWKDNMQLKIPLIKYKTPQPTVTTETIQIITEGTISAAENVLNELTDKRINEIINELKEDPELHDIFNDFDMGFDTELYDIRLENELLTW